MLLGASAVCSVMNAIARSRDQPRGTPRVVREHADPVEVVRVQAHLVAQALGVERPTLDVRGRPEMSPELRQPIQLLRDPDLEVMARNRLVECEDLGLVPGPRLRERGVDQVLTGA